MVSYANQPATDADRQLGNTFCSQDSLPRAFDPTMCPHILGIEPRATSKFKKLCTCTYTSGIAAFNTEPEQGRMDNPKPSVQVATRLLPCDYKAGELTTEVEA